MTGRCVSVFVEGYNFNNIFLPLKNRIERCWVGFIFNARECFLGREITGLKNSILYQKLSRMYQFNFAF